MWIGGRATLRGQLKMCIIIGKTGEKENRRWLRGRLFSAQSLPYLCRIAALIILVLIKWPRVGARREPSARVFCQLSLSLLARPRPTASVLIHLDDGY